MQMPPAWLRAIVRREVSATVESVALLVSGPRAARPWPDVELVQTQGVNRWMVKARGLRGEARRSILEATPSPDGVDPGIGFDLTSEEGTWAVGYISLDAVPSSAADPLPATEVTVAVDACGPGARDVPALLAQYLRSLAEKAEARATAP